MCLLRPSLSSDCHLIQISIPVLWCLLPLACFDKNDAMQHRTIATLCRVVSFEVRRMRLSQRLGDLNPGWGFDALARGLGRLRSGCRIQALMVIAAILAGGAIVSAIAADDDPHQHASINFKIPSQPLAAALQTYSKVTGVQLLYESDAAGKRLSVPVEGEYTRDAALRMLIADTDLVIRYTRSNSITLVPASADPDAPPEAVFGGQVDLTLDTLVVRRQRPSSDPSQLRAYSGIIQSDIQHALRKDAKTRNGAYSAGIKLWIDNPRTVRKTELFRSSGDQERDETIARVLEGMQVSQAPPANTPQPVTVMITVR